jgi:catechol 2,3-dioxygenase-like lactoylglutathione lyase family enzyme
MDATVGMTFARRQASSAHRSELYRPGAGGGRLWTMTEHPHLLHTAIDTTDARGLAEFYRELLGLQYRPGDEPPAGGEPDDADWLVLVDADGTRKLAFQLVERLERTTWPSHDVPMQMHLDLTVSSREELEHNRERAESLGAQLLLDRTDDEDEPLYVLADPSGHPFCVFVR